MTPAFKTLRTTAIACATLVSSALFSTTALAQAATIPTSFVGTYNMTYSSAQPGSPVTNGTQVQVVLAPGGVMCLAGFTLTNPVTKSGNVAEAHFTESGSGLTLSVSNINTGNFNEINLSSSSGSFLGQLGGSKVSTSTTGCGASTPATPQPDPAKVAELFEEAQKKLAQYFPASAGATTQTLDGYTYRFYPSTNIYLAINNGDIYVMGGAFGNTPLKQGPLEAILSELAKMPVSIPEVPSGNSTLVITGTVGAMGVNKAFNLTIDNLPMPDSNDVDDVRKAVEEQYKDSGITGTIAVTLVSSSSTSTVFNIKFNGAIVQSGFTINQVYDLTYTYTKK